MSSQGKTSKSSARIKSFVFGIEAERIQRAADWCGLDAPTQTFLFNEFIKQAISDRLAEIEAAMQAAAIEESEE